MSREIINVLEKYFDLEWYRYSVFDPEKECLFPPVVVWRYKEKGQDENGCIKGFILRCLHDFCGDVDWVLYAHGQNWVLLPKKIKELEDSGKYLGNDDLFYAVLEKDPVFLEKSCADFLKLATCLEEQFQLSDFPKKA